MISATTGDIRSRFLAQLSDKLPKLIDAKGRCPPENCGGPWGHAELLEAISDPANKRYSEYRRWLGDFDPNQIDRAAIEAGLRPFTKVKPVTKTATRKKRAQK